MECTRSAASSRSISIIADAQEGLTCTGTDTAGTGTGTHTGTGAGVLESLAKFEPLLSSPQSDHAAELQRLAARE